uniref:Transcriptional regulator n=1 Tax=Parastrongyloides trichosuri TaxID=131310 RepID=A0A0N4ZLD9_PARTI
VAEGLDGEVRLLRLELLQTDHVWTARFQPAEQYRQPAVDPIDVIGGDPHRNPGPEEKGRRSAAGGMGDAKHMACKGGGPESRSARHADTGADRQAREAGQDQSCRADGAGACARPPRPASRGRIDPARGRQAVRLPSARFGARRPYQRISERRALHHPVEHCWRFSGPAQPGHEAGGPWRSGPDRLYHRGRASPPYDGPDREPASSRSAVH